MAEAPLSAFRPNIMYVCYYVADIDRSLSFYDGMLGMKEQLRFPIGEGVHEAVLGFPDSKGSGVILMWNTNRSTPYQHGDTYSRLVVRVSDVDGATRALGERDVPIVTQPKDAPGGLRYSMIRDPDGYVVELLQLKRG